MLQDLNSSLQLQRRLILLLKLSLFYKFWASLNDYVALFRDIRLDNINKFVNNNIIVVARDYEHYNNNNIQYKINIDREDREEESIFNKQ